MLLYRNSFEVDYGMNINTPLACPIYIQLNSSLVIVMSIMIHMKQCFRFKILAYYASLMNSRTVIIKNGIKTYSWRNGQVHCARMSPLYLHSIMMEDAKNIVVVDKILDPKHEIITSVCVQLQNIADRILSVIMENL